MADEAKDTDKEQAKRKALIKAKNGGFAQGKQIDPVKKNATDMIDTQGENRLEKIVRKSFDAFEDGLNDENVKIRVDTADKVMKHFYRPAQKVQIDANEGTTVNINTINVGELPPEQREMFDRFRQARATTQDDEDVIDVDVVDDLEG